MRTRILTAVAGTVLVTLAVSAAPAAAKTVKACQKEWQADKAAMQAAHKTEKAYVAECKAAAPPAAATAPASTDKGDKGYGSKY
jgi:ABC-type proline/glycine betaine transport system substrate-binding protein